MFKQPALIPGFFRRQLPIAIYMAIIILISFLAGDGGLQQLLYGTSSGTLKSIFLFLFMFSSIGWVMYVGSDRDNQRDKFLASLPISRLTITRYLPKLFALNFIGLSAIAIGSAIVFFAIGLATLRDIVEIATVSLWFTLVTFFSYLIAKIVPSFLIRMIVMMVALGVCIGPPINLMQMEDVSEARDMVTTLGVIGALLFVVSTLIYKNLEENFINKDLL